MITSSPYITANGSLPTKFLALRIAWPRPLVSTCLINVMLANLEIFFTVSRISCFSGLSRAASSSGARSKWSSITPLPLLVIIKMSVIPALTASSTMYWIAGLSTIGNISFGIAFVAGSTLVPKPAAGITAFVIFIFTSILNF